MLDGWPERCTNLGRLGGSREPARAAYGVPLGRRRSRVWTGSVGRSEDPMTREILGPALLGVLVTACTVELTGTTTDGAVRAAGPRRPPPHESAAACPAEVPPARAIATDA